MYDVWCRVAEHLLSGGTNSSLVAFNNKFYQKYIKMGEVKRILLWVTYVANLLITSTYMCLSFATANALYKSYKNLKIDLVSNNIWRAPGAAAVLGGLMVLLFNILSCFILIKGSISKSGPGFGYGFIVAWCLVLSFFTLLCGLVLDGFRGIVANELTKQTTWTQYDTGAFNGTYGMAYLCGAMFLLFFFCLLIFQGAVSKELGIHEQMMAHKQHLEMNAFSGQMAPANPLAAAPPMPQSPMGQGANPA